MKKCPFCQEEIQDTAVKCRYCGEWLQKEEPTSAGTSSPQQSIFITPPKEKLNVKTEKLYESYIGEKNRFYYINKFLEFDKQPSDLKASWNWAAFIGNNVWALYRKMYGCFFALFGLYIILAIINISLNKGGFYVISFLLSLLSLIPWIAFGFFANFLYYRNVKKKISDFQLLISDESKLFEFLRNKGGVHSWVIWVNICVWIIFLLILIFILFEWLFAQQVSYGALLVDTALLFGALAIIAILYANINNDWELKLQNIWEHYRAYIIAVPIVMLVAGIMLITSQNANSNFKLPDIFNNNAEQGTDVEAPKVGTPVSTTREDNVVYSRNINTDEDITDPIKALEYVNNRMKSYPDNPYFYSDRGCIYAKLGEYQKAFQEFNNALNFDANFSQVYNNRGTVYANQGQYKEAIEEYNKAISTNTITKGYFPAPYYNRGIIYAKLGQYQLALEDFNKVINSSPLDLFGAKSNRCYVYFKQGKNSPDCSDCTNCNVLRENIYVPNYIYVPKEIKDAFENPPLKK